ncbi:hypothetical protein HY522_03580 [bacterium]|nr:hypothetical protein [bacterium]
MSSERKSLLGDRLKKNLATVAAFLLIMAAVFLWLTSGEHEKLLGTQRMLKELKAQQTESVRDIKGFQVEPMVDAEYFYHLKSDLDRAKKSVDILMFEIKLGKDADNPANQLVDALVSAHERGATVKVRLEQSDLDKSLTRINRRTEEYLKARGIYPDFDPPNIETHAKAVLIDGRILYAGNHNWSEAALFKNREVSLRIEADRPVSTLRRYFDKFDEFMRRLRMSGSAWAAQNVREVVFLNNEEYLSVLRESIRAARQTIRIEMYLIRPGPSEGHPVRTIVEELGAARKRGVQVSVLLDRHFKSDNQKAAAALKRAGIWDVRFDEEGVTNHSKLVVIDDEVLIVGSQNWTLSALVASNETAVYVKDRGVAEELRKKMERRSK